MAFQAGNTFVFGEQPAASKWDQLWRNDDALSDGSGIASSAITTTKIATDAVTAAKLINGLIYRRQGGDSNIWGTTGTTTYDVSATDAKVQVGVKTLAAGQNDITFPVAFTGTPIVIYSVDSSSGAFPSHYSVLHANTGFSIQLSGGTPGSLFGRWIAIGV